MRVWVMLTYLAFCVDLEDSLERSDSIPVRAVFAPLLHLGKKLRPPCSSVVAVSEPSQIGTSVRVATPIRGVTRKGSATSGFAGNPGFEDVRRCSDPLDTLAHSALSRDAEYDQILEDDFATTSRSEEIDLTLFPLAPGPYVIPYPFDDPDVCRKALDRTITPAELRRTESLLPLELSNRVNVLSALLVSHGIKLNTRYTNLVASNELRDQAYENSLIYKERTKKLHISKNKNHIFNVGDRVLLFNYRLKIFSGKLKTRWLGPFTIT
ncbi:hypothetical protein Tco_0549520 [Tanacetum coccineum]